MTMHVRRIVTGHDDSGRGIVVTDDALTAVSRGLGDGIEGCEIWSTDAMPIDNSTNADAGQRAGFVKKHNYVGSGEGTTIRIVEWAPGHAMFPHRTETLDYSILLSGEIDVEFDSGEVVHMKAGDVIVMRGVTHCWRNTGSVPAVTAFILLDAETLEVNGGRLHTLYPA
jgi:quercetin dioxygenase-like cupin family protein